MKTEGGGAVVQGMKILKRGKEAKNKNFNNNDDNTYDNVKSE